MKKLLTLLLGPAILSLFIFSQFFVTSVKADNTVVVTAPTLAANIGDVIATPSKWFFYNDENDTIDNTLGSFVSGPSTPPAGSGSVQISVTGTQRRNIATYQFSGTKLADITTLKFSTYNPSAGNGGSANRSAYLNFNVDFNGTDAWQKRLVYVPSANGSVSQDAWKEWDALNSGNALWTWSGFAANGNKWPDNNTNANRTWNDIIASFPNVRVRVTDSWLGLRVGEPYADGYTENIDAFKFGTAAGTTTFDFEVFVAPTVPTITSPSNGASVTTSALTKVDWTDSTGTYGPMEYQYEAYSDAAYTSVVYQSGWFASSEIPTPGTPPGTYYVRVRARDTMSTVSAWSNDANAPYSIIVTADATPTPSPSPTASPSPTPKPPHDKDDCKNSGWKRFFWLKFKNQGHCVEYTQHHDGRGRDDDKHEDREDDRDDKKNGDHDGPLFPLGPLNIKKNGR